MKILHGYVLRLSLKNLGLSLAVFTTLFLVLDFFDRLDTLVKDSPSSWTALQYFIYKIPVFLGAMLPVAMLVTTLLTIGILSRNSEITAMRASGLTIFSIAKPILWVAMTLTVVSFFLNETLVPFCLRRAREIFNIDIRRMDERGSYSQNDFWWRSGDSFFSVRVFDSRSDTLWGFSRIELDEQARILRRTIAEKVTWIDQHLGWSMKNVSVYRFNDITISEVEKFDSLPLVIGEKPQDFYDTKTDPQSMSYFQLRRFIKKNSLGGISVTGYLSDLNAKISFPFVILIGSLVILPFALIPARSGSMAISILAGLIIAFSYHVVHSMSIAIGRAELWDPLLAAWMANIVLGAVGMVLNLGAESPA